MIFQATNIPDAILIEPERIVDERGFFARSWCGEEFRERGLDTDLAQCSISFNQRRGTLRGLHFQRAPHAETKLVRCTRGAVFDVVVDIRSESPTCGQWQGFELSDENHRLLYVPKGCAHGFITLADNTELFYQISQLHEPSAAGGIRWNDPAIAIDWPIAVSVISPRDAAFPDWQPRARAA